MRGKKRIGLLFLLIAVVVGGGGLLLAQKALHKTSDTACEGKNALGYCFC